MLRIYLGHGASGTAASMKPWVEGLRDRGYDAHALDLPKRKAEDAVAAAQVVEEQGVEAQRAQPRRTATLWERAGKAAFGAAAASAGTMVARSMTGRRSGAKPVASAAAAAAGTIGTALGGAMFGRFARGLLGGLLR
jgi:hypothetical protein